MDYFNHGHMVWKLLDNAGGDDHQCIFLTKDFSLLNMSWNQQEVGTC